MFLPFLSIVSRLVKIDEVEEANDLFDILMGDVVKGRRDFIQENSLKVANLDI